VNENNEGIINLQIPRGLMDAKQNDQDMNFFILLNGEEINFKEHRSTNSREISIPFTSDSRELEIIGIPGIFPNIKYTTCEVIHNPPYSYILPPLKQMKNDIIPEKIICRESFVKVHKSPDDFESTACVKSSSVDKLQERGWIMN